MEDITDADYAHAKRGCKDFEIINLAKYHDLYVQSFDASNYELDRPLPKGTNKIVIGLMKDELGRKIMAKFVIL